ncbi:aldehyde dehydrogenase family protein [Streptomyces sp. NPDC055210]
MRTHDAAPLRVDPVIAGEEQPVPARRELGGVDGSALADVGSVPPSRARAVANGMRTAADGAAPAAEVMARAALIFAEGTVAGCTPRAYAAQVALGAGLPVSVVHRVTGALCETLTGAGRPDRYGPPVRPGTERACPAPAGGLFASVVAAGKHPETNAYWLRALAAGCSVVVRPGRRDPFTPYRLVLALLEAGLPGHKLALLPGDDETGRTLVRAADRAVVFGSPDEDRRWRSRPEVDVHSVGRCKVLLDHRPNAAELDFLVRAVGDEGGVRCDNASVVRTRTDPGELAERLAEPLAALPDLPVTDPRARLPVVHADDADATRALLEELTTGLTDHTGPRQQGNPVRKLSDGSYVVRPLVLSTGRAGHPTVGTELASPFAVVTPWRSADGTAALADSLVLTLLTRQGPAGPGPAGRVARAAAADPTIRQVLTGPVLPWLLPRADPDARPAPPPTETERIVQGGPQP